MSREKKMQEVIWCARQLFGRRLVKGSTGNISFFHEGRMYISRSGSCFGRLNEDSFAVVSPEGEILDGKPSKEYPLHLTFYCNDSSIGAVIHTHSLYSTALSCRLDMESSIQRLLSYTPYLRMQTGGRIGVVDYYPPGSEELFDAFDEVFDKRTHAYLLGSHGIVVGAENAYKAFDIIEEFEESASIVNILGCYKEDLIRHI